MGDEYGAGGCKLLWVAFWVLRYLKRVAVRKRGGGRRGGTRGGTTCAAAGVGCVHPPLSGAQQGVGMAAVDGGGQPQPKESAVGPPRGARVPLLMATVASWWRVATPALAVNSNW